MSQYISEPSAGGIVARSSGYDTYYVYRFRENKRNNGWECECELNRVMRKKCHHISAVAKSVRCGNKEESVVSFWGVND